MVVNPSTPERPEATPDRVARPTPSPAPPRRTRSFAGAILLFVAAALPLVGVSITVNLAMLRIQISGAPAAFALSTVYPLEGGISGTGLFLSMLGLEAHRTPRRSLELGGATFVLVGGIGGAVASLAVFYNIYFGTVYSYQIIGGYDFVETMFVSLLWTGLGLFFLSFVVGPEKPRPMGRLPLSPYPGKGV